MFKELFFLLWTLQSENHNEMWTSFKKIRLKESFENLFSLDNEQKKFLKKLFEEFSDSDDRFWENRFDEYEIDWQKLIIDVRDGSLNSETSIDDKYLAVKVNGSEQFVNMHELHESLLKDYGDIFQNTLCIPDVVIVQDEKDLLPKMAEYFVQQSLFKTVPKTIPSVILRGVETFKDVGKHLEDAGFCFSKLKEITKPSNSSERSREVEHDVAMISFFGDKILINFIQVFQDF